MIEQDIFDPVENDLEAYQRTYILSPELWEKFKIDDLNGVDFLKWRSVKMIDDGDISPQTFQIPNSVGGIYVYCIEPQIIPNCGCYVMYIGKATKTKTENLRARVRSYKNQIGEKYTRPKLHILFNKWGNYVNVHYLPVDATEEVIAALEDRLIAAFGLPPCNAQIRAQSVKDAVKAFR